MCVFEDPEAQVTNRGNHSIANHAIYIVLKTRLKLCNDRGRGVNVISSDKRAFMGRHRGTPESQKHSNLAQHVARRTHLTCTVPDCIFRAFGITCANHRSPGCHCRRRSKRNHFLDTTLGARPQLVRLNVKMTRAARRQLLGCHPRLRYVFWDLHLASRT